MNLSDNQSGSNAEADRWLAWQFAMGEPELDLHAIEIRLENDVAFAELVSQAVLEVTSLQHAIGQQSIAKNADNWIAPNVPSVNSPRGKRFRIQTLAWFAASACAVAVAWSFSGAERNTNRLDNSLMSIADHWTSFQSDRTSAMTVAMSDDTFDLSNQIDAGEESLPDWLVTAAMASEFDEPQEEIY